MYGAEFLCVWAGATATEALATSLFREAATMAVMLFSFPGEVIAGSATAELIEELKLLFEEVFDTR